jgi:diadenosine tetraphosphatase ApaH/serine/threonine PP2A family protein phosphatase
LADDVKLALISDLHANREAVTAVLEHAHGHGAQRKAFLGDFVGYGADPAWVVDMLREQVADGAVAVLGNHDAATVSGPAPAMREDARRAIEWTRAQLSPVQLAFLGALPLFVQTRDILFVHANAFDPQGWAYIQGRLEAVRSLHATECSLVFCGHMHEPRLFHLSGTGKVGDFEPTPGVAIPLSTTRRWLAIPGSAGQPRDGNPAACYAMYDGHDRSLTFHRVPYDHDAAATKIIAAGLPEALAERLRYGR